LKAAATGGQLRPDDLVWKEGTADWVPARTVAGLFPGAAPPPQPSPPPTMPAAPAPAPAPAPAQAAAAVAAQRGRPAASPLPIHDAPRTTAGPGGEDIVALAKEFLKRTTAANPSLIAPTPAEDDKLAQAGYDAVARKFAVWRRAVLWVSVVPTAFAALFGLINVLNMEKEQKEMFSGFGLTLLFVQALSVFALPLTAVFAALAFDQLSKSARLVLIGAAVSLGMPLLIAFVPADMFMEIREDPRQTVLAAQQQRRALGIGLGIYFYIVLVPLVLSLLPAVSRGCVRVKGFLPESLVPGWGLVASIPLFVLLTLTTFVVVYHVAGNALLFIGLLLWIGAPLLYLTKYKLLTRPITETPDMEALAKTQLMVLGAMAVGVFLLIVYLFTAKIVGTDKDKSMMRPWDLRLHNIWIEYLGRSLFLTVLFADLLVRMSVMVWREERAFAGTPPSEAFDRTMSGLGSAVEAKGVPPVV
jgi:hypothetical protein